MYVRRALASQGNYPAAKKTVCWLLEKRCQPDLKDWRGMSPTMLAASTGCGEGLKALLGHKPDLNMVNIDGRNVVDLMNADWRGNAWTWNILLMLCIRTVDVRQNVRHTAIHCIVWSAIVNGQ